MPVIRIERSDECLIQSGKKLMCDLIGFVLNAFDLTGRPVERRAVGADAFVQ